MKIEVLEEFVTLANTLNFGAAAQKSFISQSTLSKHISALEQELGCQLFERTNRQVMLTPVGEVLKENAIPVLEAYKKCTGAVEHAKNSSPEIVNVGYLYAAAHRLIMGVYSSISEENSNYEVFFARGQGEMLRQNLLNGTFDLIIDMDLSGYDAARFEKLPLYSDQYGAILPQDHPLAKRSSLRLSDLAHEKFILPSRKFFGSHYSYLSRVLIETLGDDVKMQDVLSDPYEIAMYARRGYGVGLLVGHAIHITEMWGMSYVPLVDESLKFDVCAIWLKSNKSAALSHFTNAMGALMDDEAFRSNVPSLLLPQR